jgi:hypothetical protein
MCLGAASDDWYELDQKCSALAKRVDSMREAFRVFDSNYSTLNRTGKRVREDGRSLDDGYQALRDLILGPE